ncbi:ATP-binding cassette domain-containing protein [Desulfohalovibrio reitneri]|uniref:ATP-binding cassette domain-containing protein n=1 Tax=Desulfohalovibrio reitneri TaxID=1307759 RepID=UPI0004A701E5|nr:ABC transporter ATP-binding protein [Desulfohalovibrio reitneri]
MSGQRPGSGSFLEVRGLTVRAVNKPLLRGVNFTAEKGRVTGLIGESGSGKSLTCQAVMGLLSPGLRSGGYVAVDGQRIDPSARGRGRRYRTGRAAMVMQNPMSCFDPVFTIKAHFRETLAAHGVPRRENTKRRWLAALSEVGFSSPEAILPMYPFQMSGGMLQRVMLALALVLEVGLLLSDEATTDLDVVAQSRVLGLMERLVRERGLGILLVTHDLSVIARLADEVLVMRDGVLVESGPVEGIFRRPKHEYTGALLDAHHRLCGERSAVGGKS